MFLLIDRYWLLPTDGSICFSRQLASSVTGTLPRLLRRQVAEHDCVIHSFISLYDGGLESVFWNGQVNASVDYDHVSRSIVTVKFNAQTREITKYPARKSLIYDWIMCLYAWLRHITPVSLLIKRSKSMCQFKVIDQVDAKKWISWDIRFEFATIHCVNRVIVSKIGLWPLLNPLYSTQPSKFSFKKQIYM